MALKHSYAVWNNKGGVGKSTIAFHLACRYAERFPAMKVLVVDLCPQANCSMMLLGGGLEGERRVLECGEKLPLPQTVVGYLSDVLTNGPGAALPTPASFLVRPFDRNDKIPENLLLLCGDGNLEPMAPLISEQAGQKPLTPASSPWKWVHQTLRKFIRAAADGDAEWMVFVDTNPSFSIYTEMAVSSVERLIVPVNADDSSRVAAHAMLSLIYGQMPPHPVYGKYTFAARAADEGLDLPRVHMVIGNRLTQHLGAAAAFGALSAATVDAMYSEYVKFPDRFSGNHIPKLSRTRFADVFSAKLRDFNTAGVVAAHLGRPVSRLVDGNVEVFGTRVQIDGRQVRFCRDAIDLIVNRL